MGIYQKYIERMTQDDQRDKSISSYLQKNNQNRQHPVELNKNGQRKQSKDHIQYQLQFRKEQKKKKLDGIAAWFA